MPEADGQPQRRLSEQQVQFVSLVEQRFWETGSVPTAEKIVEELKISETSVKKYWQDSMVREVLVSRGVSLLEGDSDLLTAQQLHLANLLMNLHDKRTVREKCADCDVSTHTYNAWMRTPAFQGYMRKRAEAMFSGAESDAYLSMITAMRSGDQSAVKLYFEMRGIYNPKVQVDVNVNLMLTKVIEIIQNRVKDPATLMLIAQDFEELETGERPAPVEIPQSSSEYSRPEYQNVVDVL